MSPCYQIVLFSKHYENKSFNTTKQSLTVYANYLASTEGILYSFPQRGLIPTGAAEFSLGACTRKYRV